jgi:hypothetical protein
MTVSSSGSRSIAEGLRSKATGSWFGYDPAMTRLDPRPDAAAFRLPTVLLPQPQVNLRKWAVVACDQFTSEPDYWQSVEAEVGDAPSTLHLIVPEVFLGSPSAAARTEKIQSAMQRYLSEGLLREHRGAVYVERRIGAHVRRGLMLELDLEHYDHSPASKSMIRPTEGTIVARLAPRIEVRRGAALELPHILVLIDDPECTVIEPIAAEREHLVRLYDADLMQGGGRVAGFAVSADQSARAARALQALADPAAFARRYGVAAGTPVMQFAVGDGNHSLATAKAVWESMKATVDADHPSRYALVEIENIHDPALAFEPIHRLLFGVNRDIRAALTAAFPGKARVVEVADAAAMRERVGAAPPGVHAAGLVGPGARYSVVEVQDPTATLAIGTFQPVIDRFMAQGGATEIDYIHSDDVLARLASEGDRVGIYLATMDKGDLLRMVVRDGPLPRKTFSMGEAHEKRYYVEARRIR